MISPGKLGGVTGDFNNLTVEYLKALEYTLTLIDYEVMYKLKSSKL